MFAQARMPIRCMGTTHADYFHGDVPVTRAMTKKEIENDYEANTGKVIVETFKSGGILPASVPAVLVANHAPFVWGPDAAKAIENRGDPRVPGADGMARTGDGAGRAAAGPPLDRQASNRKHGKGAYYGQK